MQGGGGGLKKPPGSISVEQHGFDYLESHVLATVQGAFLSSLSLDCGHLLLDTVCVWSQRLDSGSGESAVGTHPCLCGCEQWWLPTASQEVYDKSGFIDP